MSLSLLIKHFFLGDLTERVSALQSTVTLFKEQNTMAMEDLKREVTETRTVMQSALTLINGFKARLDAAMADQATMQQLSADLDTSANELAAAVAANTSAEGEDGEPNPAEPIPEEGQRRR